MSTVPELFLSYVDRNPEDISTHALRKTGWESLSRAESLVKVAGVACRLRSFGVTQGTRVGIISDTRAEWALADLAVLGLGGVTVGIYPTLSPDDIFEQLLHSRAEVLLVENLDQYLRLESCLDELPDLVHTLCFEENDELLPLTPAEPDVAFYRRSASAVEADSMAAIVYTSGTTGSSKGVVLSHRNFVSNVEATREIFPLMPGDRSIVCLPLAHSLQKFALYRGFLEDVEGYFCTIPELPEVFSHAKPTVLVAVPRMLEKIREAAEAKARQRSVIAHRVFKWATRVSASSDGGLLDRLQSRIADRLVLSKIRDGLGGSLRVIFSGGAPLSPELASWFQSLGISVNQGWGLTETCAPATLVRPDDFETGHVGQPLPNSTLSIASDGEVLVRGEGVFSAYLNDPEATAAAFTEDGFFKTGDLGQIDSMGRLRITGRKKDLIITAGGKNISSFRIQTRVCGGIVDQLLVVGDRKPYLTALIALEPESLSRMALELGWSGSFDEWIRREEVSDLISRRVANANKGLASFEQIKRHSILPVPVSVENGLLTPTMKLRRAEIIARYAGMVESLYA